MDPALDVADAMLWASDHGAVIRFIEEDGKKLLRCAVVSPLDPDERILAIHTLADDGPEALALCMTEVISEVRAEFEATSKRALLRAV